MVNRADSIFIEKAVAVDYLAGALGRARVVHQRGLVEVGRGAREHAGQVVRREALVEREAHREREQLVGRPRTEDGTAVAGLPRRGPAAERGA